MEKHLSQLHTTEEVQAYISDLEAVVPGLTECVRTNLWSQADFDKNPKLARMSAALKRLEELRAGIDISPAGGVSHFPA